MAIGVLKSSASRTTSNASAASTATSKNPLLQQKADEAKAHLAKAEKKAKPTVMRWKSKMADAGEEYCRAAILYYQAGEVEESKINLLKACDCFKKKRAWYSAAKTLEQAMSITQTQGDLTAMTELAWRSAALFRKAGQPDSAAQLLERASRALEGKHQADSNLMLEKAAETVETENRPIQAASYVNKLLRAALERDDKMEALVKARKLVELYQEAGHKPSTGRSVLGLVVLLLNQHRTNEAEIVAREFGNNCSREQNILIEDLLDAYDQNDQKKIDTALEGSCLHSLEIEYRTVLDSLCLPPETANAGKRLRSRSRRNIAPEKPPAEDDKAKEGAKGKEAATTSSSSSSEGDEAKRAAKREARRQLRMKKAPLYKGEDLKLTDERDPLGNKMAMAMGDAAAAAAGPAMMAGASVKKQRSPLVKMHTYESTGKYSKYDKQQRHSSAGLSKRQQPSAYIDVTTDSIERHRPGNLPSPAAYLDVTGVEPIQPAYMGMTVEQLRALRLRERAEEEEEMIDAYGEGDSEW